MTHPVADPPNMNHEQETLIYQAESSQNSDNNGEKIMTQTLSVPFSCCIILLAAIALCSEPVTAITITDDAGTTVTLNITPQRLISLSPSNTEILGALGLLDKVAGVTDYCDYPEEVKNIPRIGSYTAVSIEKVTAERPDLVIASDKTPKETISRLREIGLTVIVIAPKNVDHVLRDIRLFGEITGTGPEADALAADISRRIAAASAPTMPDSPTVAHVVYLKPLYISGNNTQQDDIIARAGGVNVFSDRNGWGTVSLEEFLRVNPDIIIVSGGGGMDGSERDIIREEFMTRPQYASLSAVKNSRVYAINADIISRPGPRIVEAAEEVSRIIATVREERSAHHPSAAAPATQKSPAFTAEIAGLIILTALAAFRKR